MTDYLFVEEIEGSVLQLFVIDNPEGVEEWKTLTPIEFGILSWHLGNVYYYPLGESIEQIEQPK